MVKNITVTYTGRDRLIRFATRYAKVGTRVTVAYDDFNGGEEVLEGVVDEILPGDHIPTVVVRFTDGRTADLTSDLYNNLTDYRINRIERHRY